MRESLSLPDHVHVVTLATQAPVEVEAAGHEAGQGVADAGRVQGGDPGPQQRLQQRHRESGEPVRHQRELER